MVADDIRLLIRAMTASDIDFHTRPLSPQDRIAQRKTLIGRAKIAQLRGEEVN